MHNHITRKERQIIVSKKFEVLNRHPENNASKPKSQARNPVRTPALTLPTPKMDKGDSNKQLKWRSITQDSCLILPQLVLLCSSWIPYLRTHVKYIIWILSSKLWWPFTTLSWLGDTRLKQLTTLSTFLFLRIKFVLQSWKLNPWIHSMINIVRLIVLSWK